MKAYQIRDEWSLENLQLVDLPEPGPGPGEVLVEIKAASVDVIGWVDNPETYPMAPKRHSMEHLRTHSTCVPAPTSSAP